MCVVDSFDYVKYGAHTKAMHVQTEVVTKKNSSE